MKDIAAWMESLIARDVKLWLEGDELCYDAPGNQFSEEFLRQLKDNKESIISWLNSRENHSFFFQPSVEDVFPVSFKQKQLWLFQQLYPQHSTYNIPGAIYISGEVEFLILERSFNQAVRRHQVFSSRFKEVNGDIVFELAESSYISIQREKIADTESEEAIEKRLQDAAKVPFNLSHGPLLDVRFWELTPSKSILQLTVHHIVADGWSMAVFTRDLLREYEAEYLAEIAGNRVDRLNANEKYAVSCEEQANNKVLNYWSEKIKRYPNPLSLPYDKKRPDNKSFLGEFCTIRFDAEETMAIRQAARANSTTAFQLMLAALEILLAKYSGLGQFLLGFITSNRNRDTENAIGYYANTLALAVDVSWNDSFLSHLSRSNNEFYSAVDHGTVSIAMALQEEGEAGRQLFSENPLLQAVVVQEQHCFEVSDLTDLRFDFDLVDSSKAKFNISFHIKELGEEILLRAEYATDLFSSSTIDNMLDNYKALLERLLKWPEKALGGVPLLSGRQQELMLNQWNNTDKYFPLNGSLQALFELQVENNPSSTAVVIDNDAKENTHHSYLDLNAQANMLSHHLLSTYQLRPGELVAVHLERSYDFIIAVLAILKSGVAYLPIDSEQPSERISYMLSHSRARLLISSNELLGQFAADDIELLVTDSLWSEIEHNSVSNPATKSIATDTAYVIYTSGSTGHPKGVMNTQLGICNRLLWMQDAFPLTKEDRVLHKTSIGFDVSVWEIFWPLITGAQLVLAKPGGQKDPDYLSDLVERKQITVSHFVPSMLQKYLEALEGKAVTAYPRLVFSSGESLSPFLKDKYFSIFQYPKVKLYNLYGPTEAAIDVTAWQCRPTEDRRPVPIGKPIANTEIYILDSHRRLVPIGVAGEIHIGGHNLAKGYIQEEQLTAERFVNIRLDNGLVKRLYKTGDIGKFQDDGNIIYLGREDSQIKLHGNRVEIQDIEINLQSHAAVRECHILADKDDKGMYSLSAYIRCDAMPTITELRKHLSQRLPAYMCPNHFWKVDFIPQLTSGKADKINLPRQKKLQLPLEGENKAASSRCELKYIEIWSDVLKQEGIGVNDSYFDLGGDSLRALEVVAKARSKNLNITVKDIYQYRTIAELAQLENATDIERGCCYTSFSLLTPEEKNALHEYDDAYPLTLLQSAMMFHSEDSYYNAYITSYTIAADLDTNLLEQALSQQVSRHEMLRTSFDAGSYQVPLQIVHKSTKLPLHVVDWCMHPWVEQEKLLDNWIHQEKNVRFNWNDAPLFKFYVHIRNDQIFQFSIVEPCLDGWSVSILATDIFKAYIALLKGSVFQFEPISCSFANYLQAEQAVLSSKQYSEFWTSELDRGKVSIMVPFPAVSGKREKRLNRKTVPIPDGMDEKLKSLALMLNVALKTVLLAVHIRVLAYIYGNSMVTAGLIYNARPELIDAGKVVGLFLNTLPFSMDTGGKSWRDLIVDVRDKELLCLPFRQYPLAKVLRFSKGPLFDIVFNFIHFRSYREVQSENFEIRSIKANDQNYFPLTVQFSQHWKTSFLGLNLDYNAGIFDDQQIANISDYYLQALHCLMEDIDQPCLSSPLWTERQYEHNRSISMGELVPDIADKGLDELIALQVEQVPDNIAVKDNHRSYNYRQLDQKANAVAKLLLGKRVAQGDIVAVKVNRSADYLILLFAIYKIRAIYLPLSPDWPAIRIRDVLKHSEADYLVTEEYVDGNAIRSPSDGTYLLKERCISFQWLMTAQPDSLDSPVVSYDKDTVAYIIFTSGSTGIPKGARVYCRGMINHLYAKIKLMGLGPHSVVAQSASQCFDISIWQFFAAIVVGGTVSIVDDESAFDPTALLNHVQNAGINILEVVPALLQLLVDQINHGILPSDKLKNLQYLMVTGEAFPRDLCNDWFDIYPDIRVINAYGPTECSDDITHCLVERPIETDIATVPIGKPIINTNVQVVDHNKQPVPEGVPGELWVQGMCVGGGYINNPQQTEQSFVYRRGDASPLYRTGDLVRWLPDGNLEFLGRIDQQVKIRGYRIEIAEIEACLRQFDVITDALVVKQKIADRDILAAYLIPQNSQRIPDYQKIKDEMRMILPAYMVPDYFEWMELFPVNSNGKLDRNALPTPKVSQGRKITTAPGTALERSVLSIWQQVLKDDQIGIDNNFFDLGGDSLVAVQLVARIGHLLGRSIPIKYLILHPSVELFCKELDRLDQYLASIEEVRPLKTGWQEEPIFYYKTTHSTSLRVLIEQGVLPPVHAASLGYLSDSTLLSQPGLSKSAVLEALEDRPLVRRIFTTGEGRIAHILLPVFASDIYVDKPRLLSLIHSGLVIAGSIGAQTVSLTGLIPSATRFGLDIDDIVATQGQRRLPPITTGHATTASAVVMMVESILSTIGRDLKRERVAFLGLGSIGRTVLKLLLRTLPHPAEIILCDSYSNHRLLLSLAEAAREEYAFSGKIRVGISRDEAAVEVYSASLIVGASNIPDILNIDELLPGTVVVDDSAPHCFSPKKALDRLHEKGDILLTEAGLLRSSAPIEELQYEPASGLLRTIFRHLVGFRISDYDIMGCIYSSLLPTLNDKLHADRGGVEIDNTIAHFLWLQQHGYHAAGLCYGDCPIPQSIVNDFASRHSSVPGGQCQWHRRYSGKTRE